MSDTRKLMKLHLTAENSLSEEQHYCAELMLPADEYEIRDALQHLRAVGREDKVCICILECSELPKLEELEEGDLEYISIDELNFFAKRFVAMTNEERIVFDAVSQFMLSDKLMDIFKDMKELINCTYGLNGVMTVSSIYNDEQLGQFVIDGDLYDEINELPDKAIPWLDRKKIGEQFRATYGCEYIYGTAVFAGDYEMPEIYDGKTLPETEMEDWFAFRLKIAPVPKEDVSEVENKAVWISLPIHRNEADRIAEKLGIVKIEGCVYLDFISSFPQITDEQFGNMKDFDRLNELAEKLFCLSPADQIKCKAAFEAEQPKDIAGALNIVKNLNQYEFSALSQNYDQFFREYLSHHLNTSFDNKWLNTIIMSREGEELLERLEASLTDYGVISARGRSLFELVPYRESEIKELNAQTMTDEQGYIAFTEDTEPNFISSELTVGEYMRGEFDHSENKSQQTGGMQL